MTPSPTSITVPTSNGGTITVVVSETGAISMSAIQQEVAAYNAAYVQKKNAELQARVNQAQTDRNIMMQSGSFTVVADLVLPQSYVFVLADPNDPNSLSSWSQTGPVVTPTIPAVTINNALNKPPVPQAGLIDINWGSRSTKSPQKGSWVTANKDDGTASGFITFPILDPNFPSEPAHTYMRFSAPVGPGWYQQQD